MEKKNVKKGDVIDTVVDGVGGDLVQKTTRKTAHRVGLVISIVLTVIIVFFAIIAIIFTLITRGNIFLPIVISAGMIAIVWIGITVMARVIATKIANIIGGGLITGAAQSIVR